MYYGLTNVGNVRKRNEDYIVQYDFNENVHLYIVLDGVGGHNSGDVASRVTGQKVLDYLKTNMDVNNISETIIKEAVQYANREIYKLSNENREYRGMGTTISLLLIDKNIAYFVSVGDSRIYSVNEGIVQITEDDTYINALLKDNIINEEEAKNHPQKHMLVNAIGIGKNLKCSVYKKEVKKMDKFLLCTDGLTNMLDNKEIFSIITKSKKEKICESLILMANKRGGTDNISVIYVECE